MASAREDSPAALQLVGETGGAFGKWSLLITNSFFLLVSSTVSDATGFLVAVFAVFGLTLGTGIALTMCRAERVSATEDALTIDGQTLDWSRIVAVFGREYLLFGELRIAYRNERDELELVQLIGSWTLARDAERLARLRLEARAHDGLAPVAKSAWPFLRCLKVAARACALLPLLVVFWPHWGQLAVLTLALAEAIGLWWKLGRPLLSRLDRALARRWFAERGWLPWPARPELPRSYR